MPPELANHPAFLAVIQTLTTSLEAERAEMAVQRERHAAERAEAATQRRELQGEIARLVAMVEGLTLQLDALLKGRDDERRTELAKLREQARAAAQQALDDAVTNEDDAATGAPTPSPKPVSPKRDEHGRKLKPGHLERDIHSHRPDACGHCGSKDAAALKKCSKCR